MSRRHPNPRLVKLHRSYTVDEVARLFSSHRNTIRNWIKSGLPVVDDQRPTLIKGQVLVDFLIRRREQSRIRCGIGEFYCIRCRTPKKPAGGMADYLPITETTGNLMGLCPECGLNIYRRVNRTKLDVVTAGLDVSIRERVLHIAERRSPSLNCDSG